MVPPNSPKPQRIDQVKRETPSTPIRTSTTSKPIESLSRSNSSLAKPLSNYIPASKGDKPLRLDVSRFTMVSKL